MLGYMKNYLKMTLAVISLLFLLASSASAVHAYNTYTYTDRDTFSYDERINGQNNGFDIEFTDYDRRPSYDRYSYGNRGYSNCGDRYSWRSYGCDKYDDRPYYFEAYNDIDHNTVLKEAFKTYQQNSKYEYQLEAKRIALEDRRRFGYGYGYGYSGHRYYSYGW